MGWFKRLFGVGSRDVSADRVTIDVPERASQSPIAAESVVAFLERPLASTTRAFYVAPTGRFSVVGEFYYQDALRLATGGLWHDDGIPVFVWIVREPKNKYDRNAIRIVAGDHTVGYIARDRTEYLHPRLLELERAGYTPLAQARIYGGSPDKPHYGVVVHADEWMTGPVNGYPVGDVVHLMGGWDTAVVGEQHHQAELEAVIGAANWTCVWATLRPCVTATGKYKGEQAVEILIDGWRVGELSNLMSLRYRDDVARAISSGKTPTVIATVSRKQKIEVSVLMPEHK